MLRKAILLICLLVAENAFSIGRIGHKVTDDQLDFYSAELPSGFDDTSAVDGGGAVLESGLFGSAAAVPIEIQMLSFRSQHPDLVDSGQDVIEAALRKNLDMRYEKLDVPNHALNLLGESKESYVGVAVCGDGRGYVAFAPKFAMTKAAIHALLHKTVFTQPCLK